MKHSSIPTAWLEVLEPRLAPAGLITLTTVGGILTITGDDVPNGIRITHLPLTNEWQIVDNLVGTTYKLNGVDMAGPFTIAAQNGIKADLKDGNDLVEIRPGTTGSSMSLPGGMNIKMGAGNDQLHLGNDALQNMTVSGAVTLDGGTGDDTMTLFTTASFGRSVKLLGRAGTDTLEFNGTSSVQVFQKGLSIDLGTGTDTFRANTAYLGVTGAFSLKAAGGAGLVQLVYLNSTYNQFDGAAAFTISGGNSGILLGDSNTDQFRFSSGAKFTGGSGNDLVQVTGQVSVTGALALDLKEGGGILSLKANGSVSAGSLSYNGGSGLDLVEQETNHRLVVGGALKLTLGAGIGQWMAETGSSLTAGSVSFTSLGGDDEIEVLGSSLSIASHLSLNLGAGNNMVTLRPTVSAYVGGNVSYTGGAGDDGFLIGAPDFTIAGNVTMTGGSGTLGNTFAVGGPGRLHIGGGINYTGGNASDSIQLVTGDVSVMRTINFKGGGTLGAGNDAVVITPIVGSIGAVQYTGGAGDDGFVLGDDDGTTTTRLVVHGNVSANLGTGASLTRITDTVVNGTFTVKTSSATADFDAVSFNQSIFYGAVNIAMGAGNSDIGVNDSVMRSLVNLNTGAGNDRVFLETMAASTSRSFWSGKVAILTGTGDDEIVLATGGDASALNVFYQNVHVDGGTGTNTFSAAANLLATGVTVQTVNVV